MKKILPVVIALTVTGVCCIVTAYFCHFYYARYRYATTTLEASLNGRIQHLQWEVERLAKQKHFRPIRARLLLSTTDKPSEGEPSAGMNSPGELRLGQSKLGWVISPEVRLPAGSTALHEFKISLWPPVTQVMDAWVSPPGQPEALAAFETFAVRPGDEANSLLLRVRAKSGVSVKQEFTIVVLRDSE